MWLWHAFIYISGIGNPSGRWNTFWQGFGADLPEFGILLVAWRKLNCHAKGCPRVGMHRVSGTHFVTCRKHHPAFPGKTPATAEQIAEAHASANS